MTRRHRANRGVVLLIVLTLLTLLVVVGLTFALISGQFRRAAEVAALQELHGDPPKKLLDQALYQVLRDTENPNSVLRTHSLLRDMYGESIRGVQQGNSAQVLGQWMQFTARIPTDVNSPVLTNGFLNGCVLTFVTGNVANLSTRIAGYTCDVSTAADTDGDGVADQVNATFRVLLPTRKDGNVAISQNLDEFVVNGRPFSGTGAGLDSTNPSGLNSVQTINAVDYPNALLPNRVGEAPPLTATGYLQGGMHESYDAADYQNMLLSAVVRGPGWRHRCDAQPASHRAVELLAEPHVGNLDSVWHSRRQFLPTVSQGRDHAPHALGSSEFHGWKSATGGSRLGSWYRWRAGESQESMTIAIVSPTTLPSKAGPIRTTF